MQLSEVASQVSRAPASWLRNAPTMIEMTKIGQRSTSVQRVVAMTAPMLVAVSIATSAALIQGYRTCPTLRSAYQATTLVSSSGAAHRAVASGTGSSTTEHSTHSTETNRLIRPAHSMLRRTRSRGRSTPQRRLPRGEPEEDLRPSRPEPEDDLRLNP
ncbi:hypothetical protein AB0K00_48975 [Dactylosporangium sp. NPDC049525]|uniref:hypothetical protein n=1 Tax=Dactylosporangium sp. NPDC049525 TaxID=3154730 RepID=UPI00343A4B2D